MKECINCKTKENLYIYKDEIYCLECIKRLLPSATQYCECCYEKTHCYLLDGMFICDEDLQFALVKLNETEYEKLIHKRLLDDLDEFFNGELSNE